MTTTSPAKTGLKILEEWNKINLGQDTKSTCALLKKHYKEFKYPIKYQEYEEKTYSTVKSPLDSKFSESFINLFPNDQKTETNDNNQDLSLQLSMEQPIESTQQFFSWFSKIEEDMEKGQEDIYRQFLNTLKIYQETCDLILAEIDNTTNLLDKLDSNYQFVENKTKTLKQACESLVEEQNHLSDVANALNKKLSYFTEVDSISQLFNQNDENLCLKQQFIPALKKLDKCLDFLKNNSDFKDVDMHIMRYRHCLSKGMSIIKTYFVNEMMNVLIDVRKEILPTDEPDPNKLKLYVYDKFHQEAPQLQVLIREIEDRCTVYQEFVEHINSCYDAYFSVRKQLLTPIILNHIQSLSSPPNLIIIARKGSYYMIKLFIDEYKLFFEIFDSGEEAFKNYLESLSSNLYDYLRPMIIHENRIDTLSELCRILLSNLTEINTISHRKKEDYELKLSFLVINNILKDAQQRLAFRAQSFIKQDIEGFKISDKDLIGFLRISESVRKARLQQQDSNLKKMTSEVHVNNMQHHGNDDYDLGKVVYGGGEWYPTLQRTLYILTKLYHVINQSVFEDIAEEAIEQCRLSLIEVANQIFRLKSKTDSQLFLIKNLLLFREKIAPFDANFVHKEALDVDINTIKDVAIGILNNPESILSVLFGKTVPTISSPSNNNMDARKRIDNELKIICETLINDVATGCLEQINSFLVKVSAYQMIETNKSIKSQPFGAIDYIKEVTNDFNRKTDDVLIEAKTKFSEVLMEESTENILLSLIVAKIMESYNQFYTIVSNEYPEKEIPELYRILLTPELAEIKLNSILKLNQQNMK
ncbi:Sec34-domain-containing protein [Neocallimastix lanati (nom. inval.)]|uniref:Conserved oligomeric Golgi complex subunit 3 n=1 Tax=Neocallimastix californiae TaxID=1754190 RepID=A0A1Y2B5H9_9FUNG|nr:Sec34-domain-containing protein [Neocallimastix sp. JGI-2020a]ORY30063.1 Sec34-domain-containing protein [Neocallimastix californiae]|eukprot:ORY30063.1 Sec34-domain-containing protein [Neocallimastix californiae]